MSYSPSKTLLTNELKLYDYTGSKASLTYGDADITDGYSYLRVNLRANDNKFDLWQDKPIFNIIASKAITFNDLKIWHEDNDGPMSGLNADMLDGLHATEFKDRNGHNHFNHAFVPGGNKMFVKIATFTPRRVGKAPDFNTDGSMPYQGIFSANIVKSMEATAKFEAFVEDTPETLEDGLNGFEHTDMSSEGVYNATLRASISLLRKGVTNIPPWNGIETVDIHIGIFEDPTNTDTNGWSCTSKYFYISCHERNLPFIKERDDKEHNYQVGGNVGLIPRATTYNSSTFSEEEDENISMFASPSYPTSSHTHSRPYVDYSNYATPQDPTKNDYVPEMFPREIPPGFGYRNPIDCFRLYHVDSHEDVIDGVNIVTHQFDLYMVVDTKTELHIQPYMSSSCLFYNYKKPITEAELPASSYMKPYSIYDNRYSHVEHRHSNYERKIEDMDMEIDEIWDSFDKYVVIDQGTSNANKVVMTNNTGKVVAVDDNMERHQDIRRSGSKVLVSDNSKCIAESGITTTELAQLDNVRSNVQQQIDELNGAIADMPDGDAYVLKTGDTMTGTLKMKNGSEIFIYGPDQDDGLSQSLTRVHIHAQNGYAGFHDSYENSPAFGIDNSTAEYLERLFFVQKHSMTFGGKRSSTGNRFTIQGQPPDGARVGDIWIKNE